jgi:hypothetical protein
MVNEIIHNQVNAGFITGKADYAIKNTTKPSQRDSKS